MYDPRNEQSKPDELRQGDRTISREAIGDDGCDSIPTMNIGDKKIRHETQLTLDNRPCIAISDNPNDTEPFRIGGPIHGSTFTHREAALIASGIIQALQVYALADGQQDTDLAAEKVGTWLHLYAQNGSIYPERGAIPF